MKKLISLFFPLFIAWTLGAVIHLVGSYPTTGLSLSSIYLQDNRAYITEKWHGNPTSLIVLNVANPEHPVLAGTGIGNNTLYDISLFAQKAYIAAGTLGFQIWDVSGSSAPVLLSTVYPGGSVERLTINGDKLYTIVQNVGLYIYDLDGQEPILVGTWEDEGINDIYVSENIAYIACYDPGLCVLDVSNPMECSLLGEFENPNSCYVCVSGNLLFLSDNHNDHFLLNLDDPTNPLVYSSLSVTWLDWGLFLGDKLIVIANTPGVSRKDLLVYDVSNPSLPILITTHSLPQTVDSAWLEEDYLFLVDDDGLFIYDLSDFSNPLLISHTNIPFEAVKLSLRGDYAYIADNGHRLLQLDISVPENPRLTSQLELPQEFMDMVMEEDLIYLTSYDGFFNIVRVTENDPPSGSNFNLLASVDIGEPAYMISLGNYRAYIGSDFNFKIFNVVNPTSPMLLNTYENNSIQFYSNVLRYGHYLFVTGWTGQVWVLDISDDDYPEIVASIPNPSLAGGLAIWDHYLYQANYDYFPRIYDIANPLSPSLVGFVPATIDGVYNINISGGYLFVSYNQINSIVCYELSDNGIPNQIWSYTLGLPTWDLAYRNGLLYSCNGSQGFTIIRCDLPTQTEDQVQNPSPPRLSSYPNPFRDTVTIKVLSKASSLGELTIYNIRGEEIRSLSGWAADGAEASVVWDGCDNQGRQVANGVYMFRIESDKFCTVRRLIRVR